MERIAILAGGGRLPLVLADSIVSRGGRAHLVAVRGEAGPEVEAYPHTWVTWGSINAILATIRRESNGTMMIAGSVSRPDLRRLKPDFGLIRYLPQVLAMLKGGDDAVLTRLIRFFEAQGLTVKGVGDIAPQLLADAGVLTGGTIPNPAQSDLTHTDMTLGFQVLDVLADLDVGQAIAVEDGRMLAIEGVEGTDRMLARIEALPGRSGGHGVLVKGPKRGQDLRVDLPTVGAQTVANLAKARIGTMAIVAGKTLLLERAEMLQGAASHGITIESIDRDATTAGAGKLRQRNFSTRARVTGGAMLGRITPKESDCRDALRAVEVTRRLRPFGAGRAAAVVREHVLAVAAAEGPVAMAERVAKLRQWGRGRKGRGALAVTFDPARDSADELIAVIAALDGARLAGVAVVRTPSSTGARAHEEVPAAAVATADRLDLFLIEITDDSMQPVIEAA